MLCAAVGMRVNECIYKTRNTTISAVSRDEGVRFQTNSFHLITHTFGCVCDNYDATDFKYFTRPNRMCCVQISVAVVDIWNIVGQ